MQKQPNTHLTIMFHIFLIQVKIDKKLSSLHIQLQSSLQQSGWDHYLMTFPLSHQRGHFLFCPGIPGIIIINSFVTSLPFLLLNIWLGEKSLSLYLMFRQRDTR